jgi:hypothetical protein
MVVACMVASTTAGSVPQGVLRTTRRGMPPIIGGDRK